MTIQTTARLKQVHQRSLKISYKGLNEIEYRLIKLIEKREDLDNFLYGFNGFYSRCKRKENNHVDWDKLSEKEQNYFSYASKELEKINKKINYIEEKYILDSEDILIKFNKIQLNKCYGGSF